MTELNPDRVAVLVEARDSWLEDRPVMKEHNLDLRSVLELLKNEVGESIEAVEHGDRNIEDPLKAIEQELADIGWFLLTAYKVLEEEINKKLEAEGVPPVKGEDLLFRSMMEKHARNISKYPAYKFDGRMSYKEATIECKKEWEEMGGNKQFYQDDELELLRAAANKKDAEELARVRAQLSTMSSQNVRESVAVYA